MSKPLEELCGSTKNSMYWSEFHTEAFNKLKEALSTTPVLCYPDFKKEFILDTDASFDTIGAVPFLLQRNNKQIPQMWSIHGNSDVHH